MKRKNSRGVSINNQKSAGVHNVIAKCIIIILVIALVVVTKTFIHSYTEADMRVGMALNETDMQDAIVEVTLAVQDESATTSATTVEETEPAVTTVTTISVTLEDVDTLPWATRIGSKYKVSKNDFVQLCNLVGREYGADFIPVQEKAAVVQTVMNRVYSPDFPNTVQEVIEQPKQYEGFLSRGYYSEKVTESVRLAVLGCLNGEFDTRYNWQANIMPYKLYGECNINDSALYYWGDGYFNHFYQTYEDFAQSYDYFLNHKAEIQQKSRSSYLFITGQTDS